LGCYPYILGDALDLELKEKKPGGFMHGYKVGGLCYQPRVAPAGVWRRGGAWRGDGAGSPQIRLLRLLQFDIQRIFDGYLLTEISDSAHNKEVISKDHPTK
jgi:hypothetical protein